MLLQVCSTLSAMIVSPGCATLRMSGLHNYRKGRQTVVATGSGAIITVSMQAHKAR